MIFPTGPMGVVSVSPVARAATTAMRAEIRMATTPSATGIPKANRLTATTPVPATRTPTANHVPGTSMRRSVVKPSSSRPMSGRRVKRRIVHTAENASFQPIFFPSEYWRPWYEIGTS